MMKVLVYPSDEELLRQMLAGDADAFEMLYDRRQGGVYRFALRMSGSAAVAEDVTQEVFIALMRDGHQFDPARGAVASYLYGMARHRLLRYLERERALVPMTGEREDEEPLEERLVAPGDPLVELTRREMIASVRQAVLALPAHYREVVVLCNLHELSYEQAAGVIGCPVGTVRSRLSRARALLVEKLRAAQGADSTRERAALAGD
jgi:RNA polymerase sigma-70 factor (ECF subfamily)